MGRGMGEVAGPRWPSELGVPARSEPAAGEAAGARRHSRRPAVVSDGAVGYQNPRNECSSGGAPVGLTEAQLGAEPVHCGARAVAVFAWVPWTDGQYHAVRAFAEEWTSSAVHLRWRESTEDLRDAWVWAAGVRRREPDEP